jgi:hypothetical protein
MVATSTYSRTEPSTSVRGIKFDHDFLAYLFSFQDVLRELKKVEAQCALLDGDIARVSQLFASRERFRERAMLRWHTWELCVPWYVRTFSLFMKPLRLLRIPIFVAFGTFAWERVGR